MFIPPRGATGVDVVERFPLSAATCRGIMKVVKDGEKPSVYCTVDANAGLDARKKAKEAADKERDERLGDGIGVIPTLSKQGMFFFFFFLLLLRWCGPPPFHPFFFFFFFYLVSLTKTLQIRRPCSTSKRVFVA